MKKSSNAFTYHVDPIFVIQNNLLRYTRRTGKDSIMQMSLETAEDERLLLLGICKNLISKIDDKLSFKNTKDRFRQEILKLCSQDLSYQDFKDKKEKAQNTLFAHAKLKYCIENYFEDNNFGNEVYMAGLLISMYANICNKLRNIKPMEPSLLFLVA